MEHPKPINITSELFAQRLPEEETERSLTAQITAIRPVTKNNRTYQVVEFNSVDGRPGRINVFNPHQMEGIETGMTVDIGLVRKNTFWNLGTIKRSEEELNTPPSPPSAENRPAESPTEALSAPTYHPQRMDARDYRIMSMNALTNAVNFVTAFKELLKPVNVDEAFAQVDYYRMQMMEMHDPNYVARTRESPK